MVTHINEPTDVERISPVQRLGTTQRVTQQRQLTQHDLTFLSSAPDLPPDHRQTFDVCVWYVAFAHWLDGSPREPISPVRLTITARDFLDAAEAAFHFCQNLEHSWTEHQLPFTSIRSAVTGRCEVLPGGQRSMCKGDELLIRSEGVDMRLYCASHSWVILHG